MTEFYFAPFKCHYRERDVHTSNINQSKTNSGRVAMTSVKESANGYHFRNFINCLVLMEAANTIQMLVYIPCNNKMIMGELSIPEQPHAMVLFAHGSGSSMQSPRNRRVADYLNGKRFGTLLFDLLVDEKENGADRFNITLLTDRLKTVTKWVLQQIECKGLPVGYFGASTGAAAALAASVEVPQVLAIVSRGGRPDLAIHALPHVKASTLLIVGSLDTEVIRLNEKAFDYLDGTKKLEIVFGASHLFPEEGAMSKVCSLAAKWFEMYLQPLKTIK